MPRTYRPQDLSGWTIFVFGLIALALGVLGLINPGFLIWQLGFANVDAGQRAAHDYTLIFVLTSSMASTNMGVYYVLAALTNTRAFYLWTVPFRTLTFLVFTGAVLAGYAPPGFMAVPIWELIGAVATGLALWWERRPRPVSSRPLKSGD